MLSCTCGAEPSPHTVNSPVLHQHQVVAIRPPGLFGTQPGQLLTTPLTADRHRGTACRHALFLPASAWPSCAAPQPLWADASLLQPAFPMIHVHSTKPKTTAIPSLTNPGRCRRGVKRSELFLSQKRSVFAAHSGSPCLF